MKRFTETAKWQDTWFRALSRDAKLAFFYVVENCDAAGVWEADYRLADFCMGGEPLDWEQILHELGEERVHVLANGKWYLTRFIEFQYGRLSADCKPHAAVYKLLEKHGINLEYAKGIQRVSYTLKGMHTLQDKDKDKDTVLVGGAGEGPELGLEQAMPTVLDTSQFRATWQDWLAYRKERRLPPLKTRSIDAQLNRLAGWGHDAAIQAIRDSIANNWQGLFEPKATAGAGRSPRKMSFA